MVAAFAQGGYFEDRGGSQLRAQGGSLLRAQFHFAMARLSASLPRARRSGRLALQPDGIGRRGLGGVGGVEFEPGLQISDASLQFRDPLLIRVQDREDGGLSVWWDGVPEGIRDGRRKDQD